MQSVFLAKKKQKSPSGSDFFSARQASIYLGISKARLYFLARSGRIVHFRPAGKLYFLEKDLLAFIESGRVEAK